MVTSESSKVKPTFLQARLGCYKHDGLVALLIARLAILHGVLSGSASRAYVNFVTTFVCITKED